jgi:hypothetical protein
MKNVLLEKEKIKLRNKQHIVENKTEMMQHVKNAANFLST